MAKIISIINQKGGVGKSTTTMNMGYELAQLGKKVLLVDLDPQANLSMSLGIDEPDEIENTISNIFLNEIRENEYNIKDYIHKKGNIDFLPSSLQLSDIEMELITVIVGRERLLAQILDQVEDEYDYILIDCMPSLGLLVINALAASNEILITSTAQFLSAKGFQQLLKTVMKVRKGINRKLSVAGVLITMYQRHYNAHKNIVSNLEEQLNGSIYIFNTKIPRSVKVDESVENSCAIRELYHNNSVGLAYQEFTKEYLDKER